MKRKLCLLGLAAMGFVANLSGESRDGAALSLKKLRVSGLVDTYFSKGIQNPASHKIAGRAFDNDVNHFVLNMAELEIEHATDPVGFRLDLGVGHSFEILNALEPGGSGLQFVPQAYVSLSPKAWKGLRIDFGKFYTSAGAEPTEANLNWNYSRSHIYALGPYFHMGLRVSRPVVDHLSAGFQLVNGWDSVRDANRGKTIGFTSALEYDGFAWYNAYYGGPENAGTSKGWRNFYDTVVKAGSDKAQAYLNFDYGRMRPVDAAGTPFSQEIMAVAAAGRIHAGGRFYVSPRYGWYDDKDGWAFGESNTVQDFTVTGEYRHPRGLTVMLEYRHDWATRALFERGNDQPGRPSSRNADSLTMALLFLLNAETLKH